MPQILAAVGQLCSTANVARNGRICASIIRRAALAQAKLVHLPEAADFIAVKPEDVPDLAEPIEGGSFVEVIRNQARESKVWVGVGVHEKGPKTEPTKCYNTQLLISPDGEIVQAYRKIHLFDNPGAGMLESNTTLSGDVLHPPTQTSIGKLGLLTCFDLRFPEVAIMLRRKGAQIIAYPSAFTASTGCVSLLSLGSVPLYTHADVYFIRKPPHWEVLLRARAIETQCYVLAAAQVGENAPGRKTHGHAMIVSPWGDVLAQAADHLSPTSPEVGDGDDCGQFVVAEIDLKWLENVRKAMPLLDQRRGNVYPLLGAE